MFHRLGQQVFIKTPDVSAVDDLFGIEGSSIFQGDSRYGVLVNEQFDDRARIKAIAIMFFDYLF